MPKKFLLLKIVFDWMTTFYNHLVFPNNIFSKVFFCLFFIVFFPNFLTLIPQSHNALWHSVSRSLFVLLSLTPCRISFRFFLLCFQNADFSWSPTGWTTRSWFQVWVINKQSSTLQHSELFSLIGLYSTLYISRYHLSIFLLFSLFSYLIVFLL